MAILKPSLRSSAQREAVPGLPLTENPLQSSDSLNNKRARQPSSDHESDTSSKKAKISPPNKNALHIARLKRNALKSLPYRDSPTNGVTGLTRDTKSRLDPVLVQPRNNGYSTVTESEDSIHRGINQNVPLPDKNQVDKRSLRSHDGGSRSKCELSQYFSNYDELISIEDRQQDILTPDTKLYILDEEPSHNPTPTTNGEQSVSSHSHDRTSTKPNRKTTGKSSHCIQWHDSVFTEPINATRITFAEPTSQRARSSHKDSLDDSFYQRVHLREERKEKQLRNIEKERAMHEKVQLERILEGLRGHDWLRVMGISGITDGEKRLYEPKRDHLIKEVRALLDKFRLWKEEEKRRKAEKEGLMDTSEEDDDGEEEEDGDPMEGDPEEGDVSDEDARSDSDSGAVSDGDPPGYSEADAAARQLRMEALQASRSQMSSSSKAPPKKQEPFRSFYSKPYLRQAAVSKHRRSGRTVLAFGHPLPQLWEVEFELGPDIMTPEAVMESGRRLRRLRREDEE